MGQITQHPSDLAIERTLEIVNLIDFNCYEGLRKGNKIATSEGFVAKYGDRGDNKQVFAGYLGIARILTKFLVITPEFNGGILDLVNSDIVRYNKITSGDRNILIRELNDLGIR